MSSTTKSTRKYWLQFVFWMIVMSAFLMFWPAWFWVWLPFVCTAFVQGMDWL